MERKPHSGLLIVNADDWGRDCVTTARTFDCIQRKSVSSVSAMVFMEDSERASVIAQERGIDAGLHLNLTSTFTAASTPERLAEHQQRLAHYLRRNRLTQAMFHPGLTSSFEYVVTAQIEEFSRLYGGAPDRIDGHHHMHLCANVVLRNLLPAETLVRRNFSFRRGEKGWLNRFYRRGLDGRLARRHRIVDLFYSLAPVQPAARLQRIFGAAGQFIVEVAAHPIQQDEYSFLTEGGIFQLTGDCTLADRFGVSPNGSPRH